MIILDNFQLKSCFFEKGLNFTKTGFSIDYMFTFVNN